MNNQTIFIVDTNPDFLRLVKRLLQDYYSEALTVVGTSLDEGDALAQARRIRPHIILLSLEQHFREGLQLIPRLRIALPHVRIIVLGSHDMPDYRRLALEAGADAFVAKVALNDELLHTIRRIAQERTDYE